MGASDGKTRTRRTNDCRTRDYSHERVNKVVVAMGDEGTNDEVHMEICSDVNDACCDTMMDSMANDFKGNAVEEWDAKDIGICAQKRLYKIHRGPRVTLWKQGSEILNVENITIVTEGDGESFEY